jgi:hypothetical protein
VGVLVTLAAGALAWRSVRLLGGSPVAALPWALGALVWLAVQVRSWTRAARLPARQLVACADGSLWLRAADDAPCPVTIGAGTRLIGPSVFLHLLVASNPSAKPLRTWLTPFDVPTPAIRRWSVLLPRSGRVACS